MIDKGFNFFTVKGQQLVVRILGTAEVVVTVPGRAGGDDGRAAIAPTQKRLNVLCRDWPGYGGFQADAGNEYIQSSLSISGCQSCVDRNIRSRHTRVFHLPRYSLDTFLQSSLSPFLPRSINDVMHVSVVLQDTFVGSLIGG